MTHSKLRCLTAAIRSVLPLLVAATTALQTAAQGLHASYFMETDRTRHELNPALLDHPYTAVLLGHTAVKTTGNVGVADFVYKLEGNPRYDLTTFMSPTVSADAFLGRLKKHNRFDAYADMNIVGVAFRGMKGLNVVTLNLRSATNVSLPRELFAFAKTAGAATDYHLTDIGARSLTYLELGLGHAHRVGERWRIGGKLKLLLGAAYADFRTRRLDITMTDDTWRIVGDGRLETAVLRSSLKHKGPDKKAADGRLRVDGLGNVGFGLPGFGLAIDAGAACRLTDDLTLNAALTDLGFISWRRMQHASSAGDYTFDGFTDIYAGGTDTGDNKLGDQFRRLGDDLETLFSVYDDGARRTTTALAATLNVGAEYALPAYRRLHFGILYSGRFAGLYTHHRAMLAATIRPADAVELTANTAVGSTGVTAGGAVGLRLGPMALHFGTDSFFGRLAKGIPLPIHRANTSISLGLTWGR